MTHTERPLMTDPTFWGLLVTQFLGAFNDNVFKFLVMFLCTDRAKANPLDDWQGYALIAFASPFVIFSGVCGYLADRYSKTRIIVLSKLLEIAIMGVGLLVFWLTEPSKLQLRLLIGVLFLMGSHSAFFGPSKYGILPELYAKHRLPGINGWFLMTTFVAIIGGVAAAGALKDTLPNLMSVQWVCILIAIAGTLTSLLVRRLPAAEPNLRFNPSAVFIDPETRATLRRQPKLLTALLFSSIFWFVGGIFQPLVNAMGTLQYRLSDTSTGQLAATTAVGIAIGSVLAGYLSRSRFRASLVRIAAVGMVICMAGLAIPGERLTPPEETMTAPPASVTLTPSPEIAVDKKTPAIAATGNWAEKMLSERKYGFGTVARGSKVEHVIEIKNIYKEPVTIRFLSASSGQCVIPSLDKTVLASRESAQLTLKLDTLHFSKIRTTTVSFEATWDGKSYKKAQIPVTAYIRSDVSIEPDSLQFGTVTPGPIIEKKIRIQYAGRDDWTILSVFWGNPDVSTELNEVSRSKGKVEYELTARLKPHAPNGALNERIILETDDKKNSTFPILVEGKVEGATAPVVVTPNSPAVETPPAAKEDEWSSSSNHHLRLPFVSLTGAGLLLMGAGLFAGLFSVPLQVYLQAMSPAHLKGRMIGAMNLINWIGIALSGAFYEIGKQVLVRLGASPNAIFGAIALVILIATVLFRMQDEPLESTPVAGD